MTAAVVLEQIREQLLDEAERALVTAERYRVNRPMVEDLQP